MFSPFLNILEFFDSKKLLLCIALTYCFFTTGAGKSEHPPDCMHILTAVEVLIFTLPLFFNFIKLFFNYRVATLSNSSFFVNTHPLSTEKHKFTTPCLDFRSSCNKFDNTIINHIA